MLVIGELINGMYKAVGKAIKDKDKTEIYKLAKDQARSGAKVLDVNTGPSSKNPADDMKWLVDTIQEGGEVQLANDSTKLEVMEQGL